MNTQEIKEVALAVGQLVAAVPASQFDELADEIFDAIIEGRTDDEVKEIGDRLEMAGVSVTGICKRKRPTPH